MNFNKSYKLLPIILGLSTNSLVAKTDMLFSESDVIQNNYLRVAKSSIMAEQQFSSSTSLYVKSRFLELYDKWNISTMFLSSPKMIIEDENFQNIISLGEPVIPFILEKIEREPSQLVWALNIILDKKISNIPISISEACKQWVKSWKKNVI